MRAGSPSRRPPSRQAPSPDDGRRRTAIYPVIALGPLLYPPPELGIRAPPADDEEPNKERQRARATYSQIEYTRMFAVRTGPRIGARPPGAGTESEKEKPRNLFRFRGFHLKWSRRRDSNSRRPPWQGGALPTELRLHDQLRETEQRAPRVTVNSFFARSSFFLGYLFSISKTSWLRAWTGSGTTPAACSTGTVSSARRCLITRPTLAASPLRKTTCTGKRSG